MKFYLVREGLKKKKGRYHAFPFADDPWSPHQWQAQIYQSREQAENQADGSVEPGSYRIVRIKLHVRDL